MGLGTRIDRLEKVIGDIQDTLAKLDPTTREPVRYTPVLSVPQSASHASTASSTSSASLSPGSRPGILPPGQFQLVHAADGSQQYVGPTSLDALMHNFGHSVLVPLGEPNARIDAQPERILHAAERLAALEMKGIGDRLGHDGAPPTPPPLVILEAMISPYFDSINPYMPIWSKAAFQRRVAECQMIEDEKQQRADIVCFNNVVLLTLTAKSLRAAAKEGASSSLRARGKSIDSDLHQSFLANATRAVQNIEELLAPRLSNVQALLSLYLVALVHWSTERASLLLTMAAMTAKSIGLHQWQPSQGQLDPDELDERQRVFYCLYILDKSRCWVDGRCPSVQIKSPEVWLSPSQSSNEVHHRFAARARLARVEHRVCLELYSDDADEKGTRHRNRIITELDREVQQCWSEYDGQGLNNQQPSSLDLEFAIAACAIHILVWWPASNEKSIGDRLIARVRTCLSLIQRLWVDENELGSYITISR
ncbi:C6 transcription factor [Purpureocillium lilacinum]|nr:C6 transcription factor [Purpureocillium lilacinum]